MGVGERCPGDMFVWCSREGAGRGGAEGEGGRGRCWVSLLCTYTVDGAAPPCGGEVGVSWTVLMAWLTCIGGVLADETGQRNGKENKV
jgi:hypothetical protein